MEISAVIFITLLIICEASRHANLVYSGVNTRQKRALNKNELTHELIFISKDIALQQAVVFEFFE
jgi:hypothetical protein